jgi:hypothetical protein
MRAADIMRRLRRLYRPAPLVPSRAEALRRISARLIALAQRPDLRERAMATLCQFGRGRTLRRIGDVRTVVAEVFEADAGDVGRIDRYCRELSQAGVTPRSRLIRETRFAFVRGCLSFYSHDFTRAVAEFESHAAREPTSRGALAGMQIATWLRQSGFLEPAVIDALARDPAPATGSPRTGRILLVVDGQPHGLAALAERYCGMNEIVVVATLDHIARQLPRAPAKLLAADADFWASDKGHDLRRRFDADCLSLADALAQGNSDLRGLAGTIADLARGRALPAWFLTATVAELVKRERFHRILVVTAWPLLFAAIVEAAKSGVLAPVPQAVWTARPRLEKGRFSFWPSRTSVENSWRARNAGRLGAGGQSWSLAPPAVGADTALIGLRIGDEAALTQAKLRLDGMLAQRPAIVLAQGDTRLLRRLGRPAKRGLHELRIYPVEMFAPTVSAASWPVAAQAALLARVRPRLLGGKPERRALREILLAGVLGGAAEIGFLAATVAWLDEFIPVDRIGFAGVNGADSIWLVGFAEHFAKILRAAPPAQPEVSDRRANERRRGLAAPRSAASEAPPVAAEGPPSQLLPALKEAEAAPSTNIWPRWEDPEVSDRRANERTRGLAAPRSAASEAPPVAAEGPPSQVLPALKEAEAAPSTNIWPRWEDPEVSDRRANERTRGLAAPRSRGV